MRRRLLLDEIAVLRGRYAGALRVVRALALALAAVGDLLLERLLGCSALPSLPVVGVGVAAVLWPVGRRPPWLTPAVRTGVPGLASMTLTVAVGLGASRQVGCAPGETAILLCLLVSAVRTCPPLWAVACAVLDGAATVALPLRYLASTPGSVTMVAGVSVGLIVAAGCAAGLGGYLRTLDNRRSRAVTETRRAERLAMAADLHDFVAHHVTGILVQTQMARMLAAPDDRGLDVVLAGIERSAAEALTSMRRTVGALREDSDADDQQYGGRRPVGDLSALAQLVNRFAGPCGRTAVVHQSVSVPDDLPHEVQAAAYRVVQEALTNVLRHAPDAEETVIDVGFDGQDLRVSVCDNGCGGRGPSSTGLGGGFGLVGLSERVTALGGQLHAGPRPGRGWQVVALLPAAGRALSAAAAAARDHRAAAFQH